MTKMTTKVKTQKSEKAWFFLGALAVFFMGVPYLVLGKDSVFVYHDQLDGEVIAYLLQARHLWDGSGVLPEFMNGAAKTALTMPAPACVLLYRWLPAELALACMQVAGSFAGYLGNVLPAWMGRRNIGNTAEKKRTCRFHSHADRMYVCVSAVFAGVRAVPVWIAAVNVLCTAAGGKGQTEEFSDSLLFLCTAFRM